MIDGGRKALEVELERLIEELDTLEAALPAHGLKPRHLLRIEELEELIQEKQEGDAPESA